MGALKVRIRASAAMSSGILSLTSLERSKGFTRFISTCTTGRDDETASFPLSSSASRCVLEEVSNGRDKGRCWGTWVGLGIEGSSFKMEGEGDEDSSLALEGKAAA